MSKKRKTKATKKDSGYRLIGMVLSALVFAAIMFVTYYMFFNPGVAPVTWSLDNKSLVSFENRKLIDPRTEMVENTSDYTVEKISYESFGDTVYALLRVPKNVTNPPVVIVLPAASVNASADYPMATALGSWGYATLTIDERGNNGDTPGPSASDLRRGYNDFANNGNPAQYKQVYDVLCGYDYIRSRQDLNGSDVAVLGESMGGRFAVVAAALEPGLTAAFLVSSGPYGIDAADDKLLAQFATSIEPATYLDQLPPRKLIMFHFTDDSIIPITAGRALYDQAGDPKAWHEYNGTVHGLYSDIYAPDLRQELRSVLGR